MKYRELLQEASTLSPILKDVPNGDKLINVIHSKEETPGISHDITIAKTRIFPTRRNSVYDSFLFVGTNGALFWAGSNSKSYYSNRTGIHTINGNKIDISKNTNLVTKNIQKLIGKITNIYSIQPYNRKNYDKSIVYNKKQHTRSVSKRNIKSQFFNMINNFKPLIIKELKNRLNYILNKLQHGVTNSKLDNIEFYDSISNQFKSLLTAYHIFINNKDIDHSNYIEEKIFQALELSMEHDGIRHIEGGSNAFIAPNSNEYKYVQQMINGDSKKKYQFINYFLDELVR